MRIEDVYRATRDGLDVILHYYPAASEVVGTKKKFRCRPDERTPSAVLLETTRPDGLRVWKVCDFGDEGHALSPLDVCMKEEGLSRPYEAVLRLARLFDVRDELDRSVNKPDITRRPAGAEEREGQRLFSLLPAIPEEHLRVLGPRVTQETAESLHWFAAEWVGYVRNRVVTMKRSTEHYPILMRECTVPGGADREAATFYKIYEPLNPEKGFRFSYTPEGVKPKRYVNGLEELRALHRRWNAEREEAWRRDPLNEGKPYREEKLDEAVICSGERDALCCRSMGYAPLWFNSETYRVSEEEMKEVGRLVKTVYNIPDLDETGRRKGTELALRFLDVHTAWLPEWLRDYRDQRGKPRKDLRDWMELRRDRRDFRLLLETAKPARFWTERVSQRTGRTEYGIDSACLLYFLQLNGFATLRDANAKEAIFIRVEGNVVRRVKGKDVRRFLREWAEERQLPREVLNIILNSSRLSDFQLEALREVDLDFTSFTPRTQLFHFERKSVEVTPEEIRVHAGGDGLGRYVWEENVLPHRFEPLPDMFRVSRGRDVLGRETWDVEVLGEVESCVWGYVINSSRLHWRKELETRFEGRPASEARAYAEGPGRFRIDGEGLSAREVAEQKQCLLNKLFAIGYMLHRYKSPSRAWAPQAMDNKIGENGECNGRSGKSFLFRVLSMFMKTVKLSGRNPRLMDNPHVFDQVTRHTDFVLVDDCDQYLRMEQFYDIVTSDLTVNPKNNQSYTLPFEQSPKFGFTTNYVPRDFDASTEARMLYMVYSDYYHQQTSQNDYRETRSIRDDFGRDLFTSSYSETDWNRDINFLLQCCRFYLSLAGEGVKLLPPMDNIVRRKWKADMGDNFEDWAATFFAPESGNLDRFLVRQDAFDTYVRSIGNLGKNYSMRKFTAQLRAFCAYAPHVSELNPRELCNSQGRITRRFDGQLKEVIYLRSALAAARAQAEARLAAEAEAPGS